MHFLVMWALYLSMLTHLLLCQPPTTCNAYESPSQPSRSTQFHIAPMQGYTNAQTRKMFHLLSPTSIKWTEMEKLDDVFPKTESVEYLAKQLERRLGPSNRNCNAGENTNEISPVLQLGTNDPSRLKTCVEYTMKHYDNLKEINLNCGCPAIESGGASTYGASLMKNAQLTGELVQAARRGLKEYRHADSSSCPVISVKCRIAVFDSDADMRSLGGDDYKFLKDYVSRIHQSGGNHVILHARPAVLSGLSPVKNRIVPTLDYGFVEAIAAEFEGEMDITLNGGITTLSGLRSFREDSNGGKSAVSGHMAGRWFLRRPLDLIWVEDLLRGEDAASVIPRSSSSSFPVIQSAIQQYVDDALRIASHSSSRTHKPTIAEVCLPLFLITEQLKDDYDFEETDMQNGLVAERPLMDYADIESLYDILEDGIGKIEETFNKGKKKKKKQGKGTNFKRLLSLFKTLVGTKVANKWKRNRAEL